MATLAVISGAALIAGEWRYVVFLVLFVAFFGSALMIGIRERRGIIDPTRARNLRRISTVLLVVACVVAGRLLKR